VSPEPAAVPIPGAAESDEVEAAPAPVAVAATEPDDLTKIAGIGPKMALALAAAGITTYRQLADSDLTAIRAAITGAGMRLAPTVATWPERAKQLADNAA
jgi:predicted flap endonuclease-1-like 5' DNA nuclease